MGRSCVVIVGEERERGRSGGGGTGGVGAHDDAYAMNASTRSTINAMINSIMQQSLYFSLFRS